jgi:hypothetical protein
MSKDLLALNEMVTKQNIPVFYVPAENRSRIVERRAFPHGWTGISPVPHAI